MKVANKKTGDEYYIRPEDVDRVGSPINIDVFDHPPHNGGCGYDLISGKDQIWRCFRAPSQPVKTFRGNYLEIIDD